MPAQSTEDSVASLPTATPPHWPQSNPSPTPHPARWLWSPFLQEQGQEEVTADTQRRGQGSQGALETYCPGLEGGLPPQPGCDTPIRPDSRRSRTLPPSTATPFPHMHTNSLPPKHLGGATEGSQSPPQAAPRLPEAFSPQGAGPCGTITKNQRPPPETPKIRTAEAECPGKPAVPGGVARPPHGRGRKVTAMATARPQWWDLGDFLCF